MDTEGFVYGSCCIILSTDCCVLLAIDHQRAFVVKKVSLGPPSPKPSNLNRAEFKKKKALVLLRVPSLRVSLFWLASGSPFGLGGFAGVWVGRCSCTWVPDTFWGLPWNKEGPNFWEPHLQSH